MQKTMKTVFSLTEENETADRSTIIKAVELNIKRDETTFNEKMNLIDNPLDRKVLIATALLGASDIEEIARTCGIDTKKAKDSLERLSDENGLNIIARDNHSYKLLDRMMELWLQRENNRIMSRLRETDRIFEKDKALRCISNAPKIDPEMAKRLKAVKETTKTGVQAKGRKKS